jgi:hypothetical protein
MDRYYDIDPSNRRYSEQELQHIREIYLVKQEAQDGSRSGEGRLGSAWKALLSLLTKKQLSESEVNAIRTKLPSAIKKELGGEPIYRGCDLDSLDYLLSNIARGGLHALDGRGFGQERTDTGAEQALEETAITSYYAHSDIRARLERIEARFSYVGVSLTYMETSRNYIELRLEDAADDVAYAGDTALAFEEVRQLYADPYAAPSSGEASLLARVDAALEGIRVRVADIESRLAEIRSGLTYAAAEVSLSHIEIDLADIEAGLVETGASIARADSLLSEVIGAGTGAPNIVRIPLPTLGSLRE